MQVAAPPPSTAATETELKINKPQKPITDFKKAVLKKLDNYEINKLTVIAEFYSQLILNNFILTINTELFFLFQLLTLSIVEEMPEQKKPQELTMFSSMESCIYFSMITLKNLEWFVNLLHGTLKFYSNVNRLIFFMP